MLFLDKLEENEEVSVEKYNRLVEELRSMEDRISKIEQQVEDNRAHVNNIKSFGIHRW